MPQIKLFIATTIDGFIARENGSLDWLDEMAAAEPELSGEENKDGGYGAFIADIDVVVLGRVTYEEVLGFDVPWPYGNCKAYVATSDVHYQTKTENTFVLNQIDEKAIKELKAASKKNIWVIGGGRLITQFLNNDAIDEMTLNQVSRILGTGIPLFPNVPKETKFALVDTEVIGAGMVNLTYKKVV